MRVIMFSDVHGNFSALDAVLSDITRRPASDLLVFAGDACLFGPRPEQCATRIRETAQLSLVGNTDQWLTRPPPIPADAPNPARWQFIADVAEWSCEQMSTTNVSWLERLPFAHTISPTAKPADNLLIVHANPQDTMQVIYPPETTQVAQMGKLHQSDEALDKLLAGVVAGAIAFGHLHFPNLRMWRRTLLANISSVSLPGDKDPRAKYAILEWDGAGWHAEHIRVPYDLNAEIAAFREFQPPDWQNSIATLESLLTQS